MHTTTSSHVLATDPTFFPELLSALRSCPPSEPRWRDLVRLLQELCGQAKHLQPNHRQQLLNKLVSLGLFEVGAVGACERVPRDGFGRRQACSSTCIMQGPMPALVAARNHMAMDTLDAQACASPIMRR